MSSKVGLVSDNLLLIRLMSRVLDSTGLSEG